MNTFYHLIFLKLNTYNLLIVNIYCLYHLEKHKMVHCLTLPFRSTVDKIILPLQKI